MLSFSACNMDRTFKRFQATSALPVFDGSATPAVRNMDPGFSPGSAQRSNSSVFRTGASQEQKTWPRMATLQEWKLGTQVSKPNILYAWSKLDQTKMPSFTIFIRDL
jgi:hypothetical protein